MTKTEYELIKAVKDLIELAREDDNEWETRRSEFNSRIAKHWALIKKVEAADPIVK